MAKVLTSWKEIANHFGKGVRTVQRWERELGLPILRPAAKDKQVVIAYPEDLDRWVRQRAGNAREARNGAMAAHDGNLTRMRTLVEDVQQRARLLHDRLEVMMRAAESKTRDRQKN